MPDNRILASLLGAAMVFGGVGPAAAQAAAPAAAEAPVKSDRSYYLTMRDGVRIALSLYFPGRKEPSARAPVILVQTRYGRAQMFEHGDNGEFYPELRDAGYVVAIVDTRGSTSSFGRRSEEIGPEEAADMDEIIAHLAGASWSNGEVFATGVSYMGTTSDVATSRPAPGLKGAIIRHPDFDPFMSFQRPGGVAGDALMQRWDRAVFKMDMGHSPRPGVDLDCRARAEDCPKLWPMLQPVDGDDDFGLLREALQGHEADHWSFETFVPDDFRDAGNARGLHLMALTGGSQLEGVRAQAKPVQFWGSWLDADTGNGAIARFRSAPEVPADVWVTSNVHPESAGGDPFFPDDKEPVPSIEQQHATMRGFLDKVRNGEPVRRLIHYYVMGTKQFKTTPVWPPRGVETRFLSFGPGRTLTQGAPSAASRERYEVDFTAGTGAHSRWAMMPAYPDRRDEDRKLLVYDGAPMTQDVELVGDLSATLHLSSATSDPVVIVYLEDVAPDGRVTYLTEGVLRAIHRKPAERGSMPFDEGPKPHTYLREDAQPMVPGRVETLEFMIYPVAARIQAGHRLRVAIAGADKDAFKRYSEGKPETFDIVSTPERPSGVSVQMRPWKAD